VLMEPAALHGDGCLTLVPRGHVGVVTELPVPEMAAILAGLSRLSKVVGSRRSKRGESGFEIRAVPKGPPRRQAHLRFDLVSA
jgi:hypothetical protein